MTDHERRVLVRLALSPEGFNAIRRVVRAEGSALETDTCSQWSAAYRKAVEMANQVFDGLESEG